MRPVGRGQGTLRCLMLSPHFFQSGNVIIGKSSDWDLETQVLVGAPEFSWKSFIRLWASVSPCVDKIAFCSFLVCVLVVDLFSPPIKSSVEPHYRNRKGIGKPLLLWKQAQQFHSPDCFLCPNLGTHFVYPVGPLELCQEV